MGHARVPPFLDADRFLASNVRGMVSPLAVRRRFDPRRLREAMYAHGVTQQALAERAGLAIRTVEWACSGVASTKTLRRLAEVLRVSLDDLLAADPAPSSLQSTPTPVVEVSR